MDGENLAEALISTSTVTRGSVIKRRLKDHQAIGNHRAQCFKHNHLFKGVWQTVTTIALVNLSILVISPRFLLCSQKWPALYVKVYFFSRLCHWLHEKSSFLCIHQALAEIPTLPIQCVASRFPDFYHILPIYHEILKTRKKLLILSIFLQFEFETLLLGITVSYPIMSHRVSPLKTLAVSKYSKCRLRQIKACVCERLRR